MRYLKASPARAALQSGKTCEGCLLDVIIEHRPMLIGVARSVTDFEYCCYLSDLAVDEGYQKKGIGRELIRHTQAKLGPKAKLILLSAPKAEGYYPKIGFEPHRSAWILSASAKLK